MRLRELLNGKTYFHRGLLPALRSLGPARADRLAGALGRAWLLANPGLRRQLVEAVGRARLALGDRATAWAARPLRRELEAGFLRFQARDYLLDLPASKDAEALGRFDVSGEEGLREALDAGRGVILVGAHFGAHLAALHWLYRKGIPLRLMVQRPNHVSRALGGFFDAEPDAPDAQDGFFLRRALGPTDCVDRLLRVRAAVRAGKAVYCAGDIPWTGPNTRPGQLLGQTYRLLSVWADLSALTGAPVVFQFCGHRPGGRFALTFEAIGRVAPGTEGDAVARFLTRLEDRIADQPGDAVAHLTWPCYATPVAAGDAPGATNARPSRRSPAVAW